MHQRCWHFFGPTWQGGCVYASLMLALGLWLPKMKFIRNILIFYGVIPSQLMAVAWRIVLGFEAFCNLYSLEAYHREVFNTTYLLRRPFRVCVTLSLEHCGKIIVNMVDSDHGIRDSMVGSPIHRMSRRMSMGLSRLLGTRMLVLAEGPCPLTM